MVAAVFVLVVGRAFSAQEISMALVRVFGFIYYGKLTREGLGFRGTRTYFFGLLDITKLSNTLNPTSS